MFTVNKALRICQKIQPEADDKNLMSILTIFEWYKRDKSIYYNKKNNKITNLLDIQILILLIMKKKKKKKKRED